MAWSRVHATRYHRDCVIKRTADVGVGLRKPAWLRVRLPPASAAESLQRTVARHGLHTVCREARCPNALDCHARGTATFMILGDICTRACGFCAVTTGRPGAVDHLEPLRLALAVRELGLRHVVITSVDRDDLADQGADHFAACLGAVRRAVPEARIEVLTPDFQGFVPAIATVVDARPDIYNHNVETVPRLYGTVRPKARFERSIELLRYVKQLRPDMLTKSGLMLGLGERPEEIRSVLQALRDAQVDVVTIGQYLRPSMRHLPVRRWAPPDEFAAWADYGHGLGFRHVFAGPLVRSSFHAAEQVSGLDGSAHSQTALPLAVRPAGA